MRTGRQEWSDRQEGDGRTASPQALLPSDFLNCRSGPTAALLAVIGDAVTLIDLPRSHVSEYDGSVAALETHAVERQRYTQWF